MGLTRSSLIQKEIDLPLDGLSELGGVGAAPRDVRVDASKRSRPAYQRFSFPERAKSDVRLAAAEIDQIDVVYLQVGHQFVGEIG